MGTRWLMPALCAVSALLSLGCSSSTSPSNPPPESDIVITNFKFTPAAFSVATGVKVTWGWNSGGTEHSVTFTDGEDSGIKGSGTFDRTFTAAGSYPYHCRVHPEMTGTITVTAAGGATGGSTGGNSGGSMGGGGGGGTYGY